MVDGELHVIKVPIKINLNAPTPTSPTVIASAVYPVADFDNVRFQMVRNVGTSGETQVLVVSARTLN